VPAVAEAQEQERTEQPTQKRLDEAREKGNVPRSRELTMTAVMLAGAGAIMGFGQQLAGNAVGDMRASLQLDRDALLAPDAMQLALGAAAGSALGYIAPVLFATLLAALIAPLAIGGWNFSSKAFAPDLQRLSPLQGFKRIFGVNGWVELGKALAKCLVVGGIGAFVVVSMLDDTVGMGRMAAPAGIARASGLVMFALLAMSAALAIIAAVDVPFQLWNYTHQLKMTRQEVRDELKETDGRPEIKGRIRQMQQRLAQQRMMQAVPKADVVVTNPTHFAVALKYDAKRMRAPRVVAKGADLVENRVPVFEAPALARALFKHGRLEREIPAGLYVAVAQVLTYIYQLRHLSPQLAARMTRPEPQVGAEYFVAPDEKGDSPLFRDSPRGEA
jgi:flagellar biosynthesis protein FlhB